MANFDTIKTAIDANINTNGIQDITGGKMNSILKQIVDATDEQLTELESNVGVMRQDIVDSSDKQDVQIAFNVRIKAGQEFFIRLTGTTSASRLILRYNSPSTNNLQDYAKLNTWYRFVAPVDITSIYLWYDGSVDLTCELKTSIGADIKNLQDSVNQIYGYETHISKELTSDNSYSTLFNIDIKEGQEFYIRLTGTTDASRLILRYNSPSTNNLQDYAKLNTWYRFVAPVDITSIYLWYDGSVDLTCELKTSIAVDIVNLQNATSEIVGHESHVSKEITSGNSYSTLFNLDIKEGQEFFIRLTGTTSASRLILRYNSASSNNIKDYAKLNTWYRFVAPVDITSIYLWYNGSVDLTCELKTSIGADTAIYNMITTNPLTQMPDYVVEILSKKPLGALSKGYFCLSDDDGTIGLSTYTIPMVTEKNFPITMSLFKESEVFELNGTTQQVLNAIANVGCSVAQHGGIHWTDLAEKDLADWFDAQRHFFNEIGIDTKGAVIPAHRTSAIIEAIAGAKYGVVRCGYDGQDAVGNSNYRTIYDKQWTAATSIPRSNMYCLSSSNVLDYPLDTWKDIIDNAIQNHRFVSVHMHDFDFVESAENYKQKRAILEGLIDYVKESGITIIQLGDIPGLV